MSSCIDSAQYADYQFDIYEAKIKRANKDHACSECGSRISKGSSYEIAQGLGDGSWFNFKTCDICLEIREVMFQSFVHGDLWEDLRNTDFSLSDFDKLSPDARNKLIDKCYI